VSYQHDYDVVPKFGVLNLIWHFTLLEWIDKKSYLSEVRVGELYFVLDIVYNNLKKKNSGVLRSYNKVFCWGNF
jgi:hypothetical protein